VSAISGATRAALQQAAAMVERDGALSDLVGLLDPRRELSLWMVAGMVARMLATHQVALDRIEAGHREPRTGIEVALLTLRRVGCPTSQRRLYDLMADLLN